MDIVSLAIFLGIGALAGFLASKIMKGKELDLLSNIIIGVIGAGIGGYVFGLLGITAGGFLGSLITAVAGAVILLYLVRLIKKM